MISLARSDLAENNIDTPTIKAQIAKQTPKRTATTENTSPNATISCLLASGGFAPRSRSRYKAVNQQVARGGTIGNETQ
ncbi:MAG: hypothetical protein BroJett009_19980 [Armatimonadota bacterium]|nr:MAG: hypothetical protein BroJett009_19980 [Armatimonadota bacterium]